MKNLEDEVKHLRRCIRDLVTFTALPAVWTGREPRAIAESLAEALLHTLRLGIVYVRVQKSPAEGILEAARAAQQPEVANRAYEIGRALQPWLQPAKLDPSLAIPNPAGSGTVRLAVIPIGYEGGYGMVVAGSPHLDFPNELDRLLLNVGANQVAAWIQEAQLLAARQRSEEAERVQREFFQVTLASIGDAVIVTDPEGVVTFLNHVAEDITGWRTAEATGKPLPEVFRIEHEETRQPVENPVSELLREGGVVELAKHTLLIRKDGSGCPIEDSAAPIRDDHGRLLGTILVFRDITERRKAEEALRESEQRWRTLAEALPALVWMAGPDGSLDYYNQRWYEYTGMTPEQLGSWRGEMVWHPEDLPAGRTRWREALRTGQPYEYQARLRQARDARYRWHLIRAVPLRDHEGRILRWFGANIDIEEQKHTTAELQRVNEELQQFAYIVSHDLKEPLRNIAQLVTFLAEDYQDQLDTQATGYITRTVAATQRLQQMLNDLLTYTQVGGRDLALGSVDCEALLTTVLEDLQVTIAEQNATLTHDPLPTVGGDAILLGQVFQNLIGNALKFHGTEPPRIHVSAQRDGTHWRFSVCDNGIGIEPHQTTRLFQVFQRLHTRSQYLGTGIGLAICKKIVERHGGRIWVNSLPGQGATFFFTISAF